MQITKKELDHVAAAEAPRADLYAGIHKALRACMADTLLALGRMDPADEAETGPAMQRVLELLAFCRGHLAHENAFVHTAIEARAPGASDVIAHEHEEHLRAIADLEEQVQALWAAPAGRRDAAALRLYRALALFVAENFQHMNVEETAHNAVLWARYTDAELGAIHDAIVGAIPPQEMMEVARWLLPYMHHGERVAMLSDVRAKAPPPAFAAMLEVARPHLSTAEWSKLSSALGLLPVRLAG